MSSLLGFAQSVARKCGVNITLAANTLEHKRAEILKSYEISVVLDVGANLGQFAREVRQTGYRGRIVSFEPVSKTFEALVEIASEDPHHDCMKLALGDEDRTMTIHVSEGHASSSILQSVPSLVAAAPSARQVASEEIAVARLDTIRTRAIQEADRVYLKIDTQGYEDRVIRGASNSLSQVFAIEVEFSLVELYKEQALLPHIWEMLLNLDFHPIWIERCFSDPVTGFMLQCDSIFLRNKHGL